MFNINTIPTAKLEDLISFGLKKGLMSDETADALKLEFANTSSVYLDALSSGRVVSLMTCQRRKIKELEDKITQAHTYWSSFKLYVKSLGLVPPVVVGIFFAIALIAATLFHISILLILSVLVLPMVCTIPFFSLSFRKSELELAPEKLASEKSLLKKFEETLESSQSRDNVSLDNSYRLSDSSEVVVHRVWASNIFFNVQATSAQANSDISEPQPSTSRQAGFSK